MSDLSKKKCVACDGNISPFDTSEIHKYLKKIDGWDVKNNEDKSFYLKKVFKFKNFEESQNFVNKVGHIAEEENHHPDICFGWGYFLPTMAFIGVCHISRWSCGWGIPSIQFPFFWRLRQIAREEIPRENR